MAKKSDVATWRGYVAKLQGMLNTARSLRDNADSVELLARELYRAECSLAEALAVQRARNAAAVLRMVAA